MLKFYFDVKSPRLNYPNITMKKEKKCKLVFDRKKKVKLNGYGTIEICVPLSNHKYRYITMGKCTDNEWTAKRRDRRLIAECLRYDHLLDEMKQIFGPNNLTQEEFNIRAGFAQPPVDMDELNERECDKLEESFIDFCFTRVNMEKSAHNTKVHKHCTINAIIEYGRLKTFKDLTPEVIRGFDDFLHDNPDRYGNYRTDVTVWGYHKHIKTFIHDALQYGYKFNDPYVQVSISKGKSKERHPLCEAQLLELRNANLNMHLGKIRDLFIFSAYTGLAYCDMANFNFHTMTEEIDGVTYIDGTRLKTKIPFFTPILAPAMEVLKRYRYRLPKMSNQKCNDGLHVIEEKLGFRYPLTFHIARHSFATLCLTKHIPIENVARMMGHSNITTTQIYAKLLRDNMVEVSNILSRSIL